MDWRGGDGGCHVVAVVLVRFAKYLWVSIAFLMSVLSWSK